MPSYTRGQSRDVVTFVLAYGTDLFYGWSTKDFPGLPGARLTNNDLNALGHLLPEAVPEGKIRVYAANSPKPPRMKKVINANPNAAQQGSVSTFCGINSIKTAETAKWKFVKPGRGITVTNNARTKTMAAKLTNNSYYLFPMNANDATKYAAILGLVLPESLSEANRKKAFVGASRPRPARVKKASGDDLGFSTFCSSSNLNNAKKQGFEEIKPEIEYA